MKRIITKKGIEKQIRGSIVLTWLCVISDLILLWLYIAFEQAIILGTLIYMVMATTQPKCTKYTRANNKLLSKGKRGGIGYTGGIEAQNQKHN